MLTVTAAAAVAWIARIAEGLAFVFWHPVLQNTARVPASKLTQSRRELVSHSWQTDSDFVRDWNVHWRRFRKNPTDPSSAHDSSSGISMWITALHLDGAFFCVCVFFLFGWTFAANGTCPAECWLWGSPCFFVNLNEKGRGGRGENLPCRSPLQPRGVARRGKTGGLLTLDSVSP